MLTAALLALCISAQLAACAPSASSSHFQPSSELDFEIDGILFHNKSLGMDRHFDVLGHQCSPGKPPLPEDGTVRYTPNRVWPTHAKDGRAALVVALGGPLERFLKNMEVSLLTLMPSYTAAAALQWHAMPITTIVQRHITAAIVVVVP